MDIEMVDEGANPTIIKVIGVGGAGGNAASIADGGPGSPGRRPFGQPRLCNRSSFVRHVEFIHEPDLGAT